jgi:hypothetical protein
MPLPHFLLGEETKSGKRRNREEASVITIPESFQCRAGMSMTSETKGYIPNRGSNRQQGLEVIGQSYCTHAFIIQNYLSHK